MQKEKDKNSKGRPQKTRISIGTAIVLDLLKGKMSSEPSTAYLMTYKDGKCIADCEFCPQAKSSKSSTELLSRITWPIFPTSQILSALAVGVENRKIKRICIQALNYPEVFKEIESLVIEIKKQTSIPISVSCQPQTTEQIKKLALVGVDRIGIALDAATPKLFEKVKGSADTYRWENTLNQLKAALKIFGKGKVSTHLIVGLGETENESITIIQRCVDMGIQPALFAFTPIQGTKLENQPQPSIKSYRRIQLARYLIINKKSKVKNMQFDNENKIADYGVSSTLIDALIEQGSPFLTSGCTDCNRPYYNEKPSGPIYNFPKHPTKKEIEQIKKELT